MPFSIRTTLFLVKAFIKKYNARELSDVIYIYIYVINGTEDLYTRNR